MSHGIMVLVMIISLYLGAWLVEGCMCDCVLASEISGKVTEGYLNFLNGNDRVPQEGAFLPLFTSDSIWKSRGPRMVSWKL